MLSHGIDAPTTNSHEKKLTLVDILFELQIRYTQSTHHPLHPGMQMAYSELGLAEMLQSGALFVLSRVRRNTNNIPQPSSHNVVPKICGATIPGGVNFHSDCSIKAICFVIGISMKNLRNFGWSPTSLMG